MRSGRSAPSSSTLTIGRVTSRVVETIDDDDLLRQWDDLACALEAPRSAPDWVRAWYHHVLDDVSRQAILTAWADTRLVGVVPLFRSKDRWGFEHYRLAGHQTIVGVEPLVDPDSAPEAMVAFGDLLSRLRPRPDTIEFECVPLARRWLQQATGQSTRWAGRIDVEPSTAPRLVLADGGHEAWVAARGYASKKQARRYARRLAELGYEHRISTHASEIISRLPALRSLYEHRKQERGGWGMAFDASVLAMMSEAVTALAGRGRVVMSTIESDDSTLAADLLLVSGRTISAWVGAVGPELSQYSPGRANLLGSIEWANTHGIRAIDWGPGDEPYKSRISNDVQVVERAVLQRRGIWPMNTPAALIPPRVRTAAHRTRAVARRMRRA